MADETNPHDKLFKETFLKVDLAAAELQAVLPRRVRELLDWNTLELAPAGDDRVGQSDRTHDLLYRANTRAGPGHAYVHVLFEHQSTPDATMPLRLLEYMVRIWRSAAREQGPTVALPPIIPVVLSHAPGGWRSPRSLLDLLGPAGADRFSFAPFTPDFEYLVDDLAALSDHDLRARALPAELTVSLWALRDGRLGALVIERSTAWLAEFERLAGGPTGDDAMWRILQYLVIVGDRTSPDPQALIKALSRAGPATEKTAMNNLEKFKEEIRSEALAQRHCPRPRGGSRGRSGGRSASRCLSPTGGKVWRARSQTYRAHQGLGHRVPRANPRACADGRLDRGSARRPVVKVGVAVGRG